MKFNKLDIITKFTLTFGITGMVAACIGVGIDMAAITTIGIARFNKTTTSESCVNKVFYVGNILIGSGLFVVGSSIAIAKYAGENLSDSYFNEGSVFTEEQEKYLSKTHKCNHCKYFHGHQYYGVDLICAVYPDGWEGDDCPDRQVS